AVSCGVVRALLICPQVEVSRTTPRLARSQRKLPGLIEQGVIDVLVGQRIGKLLIWFANSTLTPHAPTGLPLIIDSEMSTIPDTPGLVNLDTGYGPTPSRTVIARVNLAIPEFQAQIRPRAVGSLRHDAA